MTRLIVLAGFFLGPLLAIADEAVTSRVHYLANGSVMVERGATKILFDPLFRNDYGQYDRVPAEMEKALFAGTPPWDSIDAIFISHNHDDHFDPELLRDFLTARSDIQLYAPRQASAALVALLDETGQALLKRIHGVELEDGTATVEINVGPLLIEAVRIPHAGWPDSNTDVDNIAFRVTLDDATTITHLGDADPGDEHFEARSGYWSERPSDLALPPFWFFLSPEGRYILDQRIGARDAIGLHVPTRMPDDVADRPPRFQGFDLFTQPGETREINTDR